VHPLRCTNSFEKGLLETRETRGIVKIVLQKWNASYNNVVSLL
jgi:hypothetical protein